MGDIFLRLMLMFNPFISSMRDFTQKKFKSLLSGTVELVILPSIGISEKSSTYPHQLNQAIVLQTIQ